jgi:hypothetical protein
MSGAQLMLAPVVGGDERRRDEPTLDQAMARIWELLEIRDAAACPVCRGLLERSADGMRATCRSCGSVVD